MCEVKIVENINRKLKGVTIDDIEKVVNSQFGALNIKNIEKKGDKFEASFFTSNFMRMPVKLVANNVGGGVNLDMSGKYPNSYIGRWNLAILCGFLLGILPGIYIWLLYHQSYSASVKEMHRSFDTVINELEFAKS